MDFQQLIRDDLFANVLPHFHDARELQRSKLISSFLVRHQLYPTAQDEDSANNRVLALRAVTLGLVEAVLKPSLDEAEAYNAAKLKRYLAFIWKYGLDTLDKCKTTERVSEEKLVCLLRNPIKVRASLRRIWDREPKYAFKEETILGAFRNGLYAPDELSIIEVLEEILGDSRVDCEVRERCEQILQGFGRVRWDASSIEGLVRELENLRDSLSKGRRRRIEPLIDRARELAKVGRVGRTTISSWISKGINDLAEAWYQKERPLRLLQDCDVEGLFVRQLQAISCRERDVALEALLLGVFGELVCFMLFGNVSIASSMSLWGPLSMMVTSCIAVVIPLWALRLVLACRREKLAELEGERQRIEERWRSCPRAAEVW